MSVPVSPRPTDEPGDHPVAEAGQQVVVDAAVDPGGQGGEGGAVADLGPRSSPSIVVSSAVRSSSGPVRGDLEPGCLHLVPVPERHGAHPASRPRHRSSPVCGWP